MTDHDGTTGRQDSTYSRRRILTSTAGLLPFALAAPASGRRSGPWPIDENRQNGPHSGPTAPVKAYYQRAWETETDDFRQFASDVGVLSHSGSPLPDLIDTQPRFLSTARRREIDEVAVTERDVPLERFTESSTFLRESLTAADEESIAATNAVVTVTFESAPFNAEWLVATEDDEWRLVYVRAPRPDGPTATVRQYYRQANADSVEEFTAFADVVDEVSHRVSPLGEIARQGPSLYSTARRATVLDVGVVGEGIAPQRVLEESPFLRASLGDDDVSAIAAENAVVSVHLDVDGSELVQQWFLATDDQGWGLVWVTDLSTPRAVVRELYRIADRAEDDTAVADEVDELSHSASIMPGSMRRTVVGDSVFSQLRQATLLETEIVARNIDAGGVTNRLGGRESAPKIQSIAAENAVVTATVAFEQLEGPVTTEYIVAPEDGEWRIVWF